jgi:hypothetical protein
MDNKSDFISHFQCFKLVWCINIVGLIPDVDGLRHVVACLQVATFTILCISFLMFTLACIAKAVIVQTTLCGLKVRLNITRGIASGSMTDKNLRPERAS